MTADKPESDIEVARFMNPRRLKDESIDPVELECLALFRGISARVINSSIDVESSLTLRVCEAGESYTFCRAGDPGRTAFYILTTDECLELRKKQKERLLSNQGAESGLGTPLTGKQLDEEICRLEKQKELQNRTSPIAPVKVGEVQIPAQRRSASRKASWRDWFTKGKPTSTPGHSEPRLFLVSDSPALVDPATRRADLHEGDLFGEISCLERLPRFATVYSTEACYVLEIFSSSLEKWMRASPLIRERLEASLEQRVRDTALQQLPFLLELPRPEREVLERVAEFRSIPAGHVLFEEGDAADAVYVIISGLIKVLGNAQTKVSAIAADKVDWRVLACELLPDRASSAATDVESQASAAPQPSNPSNPLKSMQRKLPRAATSGQNTGVDGKAAVSPQAGPQGGANGMTPEDVLRGEWLKRFWKAWDELEGGTQGDLSDAKRLLGQLVASHSPTDDERATLVAALNSFIVNAQLHTVFKSVDDLNRSLAGSPWHDLFVTFGPNTENWSVFEQQTFHRCLISYLAPRGLAQILSSTGPREVYAYRGSGDVVGTEGLTSPNGRWTSTCIAYDHPDSGDGQKVARNADGSPRARTLVLKFRAPDGMTLSKDLPEFHRFLKRIADEQHQQQETRHREFLNSPDLEELGLFQGHHLMLIDLHKCTRCNACVEACEETHDDRRARLYLDGPRFQHGGTTWLSPLTCRQCVDPVCMIPCPVASIYRGPNQSIQIADWCIGCEKCANECPYGAIQMHPKQAAGFADASARQEAGVKIVDEKANTNRPIAVVCDLCVNSSLGEPACVYACPHDATLRRDALDWFPHGRE